MRRARKGPRALGRLRKSLYATKHALIRPLWREHAVSLWGFFGGERERERERAKEGGREGGRESERDGEGERERERDRDVKGE